MAAALSGVEYTTYENKESATAREGVEGWTGQLDGSLAVNRLASCDETLAVAIPRAAQGLL